MPVVSSLFIYPIKSCAGIAVTRVDYSARGLHNDRQYMVVDAAGKGLTQREVPKLAHIQPVLRAEGLTVHCKGQAPLELTVTERSLKQLESRSVSIWNYEGAALDLGPSAATWFSGALGTACRLVRFSPSGDRPVSQKHTSLFAQAQFSDGYPLLVTSVESLQELNRRLTTPVPMNRFRPNVVFRDVAPFAEDDWRIVSFPHLVLHIVKPCERCVIASTNQNTLERGKEPLRTLATFRTFDGKVCFGQNSVPESDGHLTLGDEGVVTAARVNP
jgi:uncharacterized protein